MNWINNFVRPKIRNLLPSGKREVPENMWVKCPDSGQMVYYKDLEANQFVIPGSNYHMRMTAQQRLTQPTGTASWPTRARATRTRSIPTASTMAPISLVSTAISST